jgi:hypothetical protein
MATIECYYKWCPNHEANHLPAEDSGPFCNNDECNATTEELAEYARKRSSELERFRFLEGLHKSERWIQWP